MALTKLLILLKLFKFNIKELPTAWQVTTTIMDNIFETNSSLYVKKGNTGKSQFRELLLVLKKSYFGRMTEHWAIIL